MVDPLATLLAEGIVDEVLARLKSGKEADLWLVRHAGEVVAAKVYKARQARSFRNRAAYQEGRQVRNTRTRRAMDRGSRFGRAEEEDAWTTKEADALHALHAAGVRVPRPVGLHEGVLLMELVVDAAGHPAPRLVDARVSRDRAAALYADLRGQAIRMLTSDLIHGDLSPYNVLLGRQGPVVIDFPQVIGAAHNHQAERYFRRDLENVRRFFTALDPALHRAAGDAGEIWQAYVRRELTGDFVPTGRSVESPRRRHSGRDAGQARRRGEPWPDPARRQPPRPGRHAPAPEVSHVVRPPLGPVGTRPHEGAPTAAAKGGTPPSGTRGAALPDGANRRRRRRRRRGRPAP